MHETVTAISTSATLDEVKYEIRGKLARRADELERQGYEIVSLNIGNPGLFGFRTPETMRLATQVVARARAQEVHVLSVLVSAHRPWS